MTDSNTLPTSNFINTRQACEFCDVGWSAINKAIKQRKLKAKKINGRYMIEYEDLKVFISNRYSRKVYSTYEGKPLYDNNKGEYSIGDIADMLKVKKNTVYYYIRSGQLHAIKRGWALVVLYKDIMQFYKAKEPMHEISFKK